MSVRNRPQSAAVWPSSLDGPKSHRRTNARIASAPASRRAVRGAATSSTETPPKSAGLSRAPSAKSTSAQTRRDSVFSPWTSRAASARAALNLRCTTLGDPAEHFAVDFELDGFPDSGHYSDGDADASVSDLWGSALPSRVASATHKRLLPAVVAVDNVVDFGAPRDRSPQETSRPKKQARPRSSVKSPSRTADHHPIPVQARPPHQPQESVLTRTGSVAPYHVSLAAQRRRLMPNETLIDMDAVRQEGIYPLIHREWIPPTADVTRAFFQMPMPKQLITDHPGSVALGRPRPASNLDTDADMERQNVAGVAAPVPKTPTQSLTDIAVDESTLEIDRQIIISNRTLVKEAPGYAWFQETAVARTASKAYIVQLLVEVCHDYKIDWAQISCNKVFDLLNRPFVLPVSREDLLECLVNKREVEHLLAIPEHRYHKPSAAPTVIQSWWRMGKTRRKYQYEISRIKAARKLFWIYRRMSAHRILRARIQGREQGHYDRCQKLGLKMKREWDRTYKGTRKVYIHFAHKQVLQGSEHQVAELGRLLSLHDLDVSVVFVVQTNDRDIRKQMDALIGLSFPPSELNRLTILTPESASLFCSPSSPASWILASPKTLKTLTDLGRTRNCIIIPGDIERPEIELSSTLNIPLSRLPSSPRNIPLSIQTRIFEAARVPFAPAQETLPETLYSKLNQLQAEHPNVSVWGVYADGKIQDFHEKRTSAQVHSIATDVPCTISGLLYDNDIEASSAVVTIATACMFVEPDGYVVPIGVCDQAYDTRQNPRALGPMCVMYPAQSCSSIELQQQACTVTEHAYKELGLFGFMTVEFTLGSHIESRNSLQGLRIIADYSTSCSGLQTFMLATGTLYSQGSFASVASKPERRELAYTDQIPWVDKSRLSRPKAPSRYHRVGIHFPTLRHVMLDAMSWAGLVAITEASYDLKAGAATKTGTLFPRISTRREAPYIDMMCMAADWRECAQLAFLNLNLIDEKLRSAQGGEEEISSLKESIVSK
ncbi:hypothetical protein HDU89_006755 [Geranomyces variabilis]|nr:hypothetical protein HDU89_006755 [Geranomyces variabilis]